MANGNGGGVWKWIAGILASVLVAVMVTVFSTGGTRVPDLDRRVGKAENRLDLHEPRIRASEQRGERIETKLDALIQEVSRLRNAVERQ